MVILPKMLRTVFCMELCIFALFLSGLPAFGVNGRPEPDTLEDVENFDSDNIDKTTYMPLLRSVVYRSEIRYRYCRTRIVCDFVNHDKKNSYEANFQVVIPQNAFISDYQVKVDGRLYNSNVTTREEAIKLYEASKRRHPSISSGIVELSNKGAYTFNLTQVLGAGKTTTFLLIYEEQVQKVSGLYEHSIHFIPEQFRRAKDFKIAVNIHETQNFKMVSIPKVHEEFESVNFEDAYIIKSGKFASVRWNNSGRNDEDTLQGTFSLQYELEESPSSGEIVINKELIVFTFGVPNNASEMPKHVVFVLDVSDSMVQQKLSHVQKAMEEAIEHLRPTDFFNIITFSSDITIWDIDNGENETKPYPYPATIENKGLGTAFIRSLQAQGSTNMFDALMTAIEFCRNASVSQERREHDISITDLPSESRREFLPENVESMIIFLTDGEPTSGMINRREIQVNVRKLNSQPVIPIYSLAFGEDADFEFLHQISHFNMGFCRRVFVNKQSSMQISKILNEIFSQVLRHTNISFETNSNYAIKDVSSPNMGSTLSKGGELTIVGSIQSLFNNSYKSLQPQRSNGQSFPMINVRVNGVGRFGNVSYDNFTQSVIVNANTDDNIRDSLFLKKLVAYVTIKNHVEKDVVDDCPSSVPYHKSPHCKIQSAREKATQLALEHKFVTPYTSFIMTSGVILRRRPGETKNPTQPFHNFDLQNGNGLFVLQEDLRSHRRNPLNQIEEKTTTTPGYVPTLNINVNATTSKPSYLASFKNFTLQMFNSQEWKNSTSKTKVEFLMSNAIKYIRLKSLSTTTPKPL